MSPMLLLAVKYSLVWFVLHSFLFSMPTFLNRLNTELIIFCSPISEEIIRTVKKTMQLKPTTFEANAYLLLNKKGSYLISFIEYLICSNQCQKKSYKTAAFKFLSFLAKFY
ncbi:hypothetical protein BpHYR1_045460 [Brachionus plicatilis]|uniref:Uncharacterized protein n=1 Tax=Brachionus plicatilis TaxID=10195 RepID=A0A3M7T4D7_BRAPC|nr:hypothetical protein BpHYR1_045460 [Brachionus plicatilis]